jgi:hypothetical protein
LLRYADEFSSRTVQALDVAGRRLTGTDGSRMVLEWKVNSVSSVVAVVTGPNPHANLIDTVGLVTLSRMVLEEYWIETPEGAAFQPWLSALRELEVDIWNLAGEVLQPEVEQELRTAIGEWFSANSEVHRSFFRRPHSFATSVRQDTAARNAGNRATNLASLDPFSGLDPAVREIAESRLFAERALFSMQHMPPLLRWQSELLMRDLATQPAVTEAMTQATRVAESADRASLAAASISQTVAVLPDRISAERKALVTDLERQEGRLKPLVSEVRQSLVAGKEMADALHAAIRSLGELTARGDQSEPSADDRPFDILDYAATAERVTVMAQELDTVIRRLDATLASPAMDRRVADLDGVTSRVTDEVRGIITYSFVLAAALVLLVFACSVVYRRTTRSTSS